MERRIGMQILGSLLVIGGFWVFFAGVTAIGGSHGNFSVGGAIIGIVLLSIAIVMWSFAWRLNNASRKTDSR
jgi:hypothetical protein